ncbi:MAG: ABC transporter permease, partial [Acidobacteria bacterium]|nr:ABC transporter permease [Acidobacteriota bacterium]
VRYALRALRRAPAFTLVAVLVLALGTGANTSIFAFLDELLLRPAPVFEPDRLVLVRRADGALLSYGTYRDLQVETRVLDGMAAALPFEADLASGGRAEFIVAEAVSGTYGPVLGVRAALGRWFDREDEPAAVISQSVWESWFNRDPGVIGRVVQSQSQSYTIVGVAPPEFTGRMAPMRTDLWIPFQAWSRQRPPGGQDLSVMVLGRLGADRSASQAAMELNAVDTRLQRNVPASRNAPSPITVEHVRGAAQGNIRQPSRALIALLTIVAGLVLAIACVNVGSLLLVRGSGRHGDFAVRSALGASRGRLFRQVLTETFLVVLLGSGSGLLAAWGTNHLLVALLPTLPFAWPLQFDAAIRPRTLGFAALVAGATTLVCGLVPAWRISGASRLWALKGQIQSRGHVRGRTVATVGQVAASLMLLLTAGTVLQGLWRLQAVDPGFAVESRLYASLFVPADPSSSADASRQVYVQALERVRALPNIQQASLTHLLPLSPAGSECVRRPGGETIQATTSTIDTGFLSTMGIRLAGGRNFDTADSTGPPVVIVNEALARRVWPGASAPGERIEIGCDTGLTAEVVGVARDSAIRSLADAPQPHIYRAFSQHHAGLATIVMETRVPPALLVTPVRQALQEFGERLRVYDVELLGDHVERSYWAVRWQLRILALFGLLALALAAMGLYGVIAYRVALRTRDIGVRLALGATPLGMLTAVLRQGLVLAVLGIAIGSVLGAGLSALLARIESGLEPTSPSTYLATGLIWIAVTLLACFIPARRAASVDPVATLRAE